VIYFEVAAAQQFFEIETAFEPDQLEITIAVKRVAAEVKLRYEWRKNERFRRVLGLILNLIGSSITCGCCNLF
jgi:hypothetical protein